MHRAFISSRDYEAYETPESAALLRSIDREDELAARAVYESQQPVTVGDEETRAINAKYGIPDAKTTVIPAKFRKVSPPVMDVRELSTGPNLPHRDDRDVSERSRARVRKIGYYQSGTHGYLSDAYMDKMSPIDRKASTSDIYRRSNSEAYVLPHGLDSSYRLTWNDETETWDHPHKAGNWGKPLTARNKHLAAERDPTAWEALRNVNTADTAYRECPYLAFDIGRGLLSTWITVHDIAVTRGKIQDNGRSDILARMHAKAVPGETCQVDLYDDHEIRAIVNTAPKKYRKGHMGAILADIAKSAK